MSKELLERIENLERQVKLLPLDMVLNQDKYKKDMMQLRDQRSKRISEAYANQPYSQQIKQLEAELADALTNADAEYRKKYRMDLPPDRVESIRAEYANKIEPLRIKLKAHQEQCRAKYDDNGGADNLENYFVE